MSETSIVGIVGLCIIGIFLVLGIIICLRDNKKSAQKYTNFHYRIKYKPMGLLGIKWGYFGEIYTIVPFKERLLMETGPYLDSEEAMKETELIVTELRKNGKSKEAEVYTTDRTTAYLQ